MLNKRKPFAGFFGSLKECSIDAELSDGRVPCQLLTWLPKSSRVQHPHPQRIETALLKTNVTIVALSISSLETSMFPILSLRHLMPDHIV